ncbi:NADP-dependent 3-hydroxy acid dehydrogenase YdfG [Chitinophaga skermanii]|uniref:NADP-dependent 3-hydroxy acid dehydrogenase YdfG n=1 Tax=Chitinophaga skermanii TaxID=331697 RepID=A0A327QD56_9BACT|nr:SDR family oxidoreductase [Chitinophaga skermanii]RAJ01572.1 NADP-dependent 3-hydroxy acid dehydrogenase YdfG [Chitinophaga skermanii]
MKYAVITGATKGIGRAVAEKFAAEGVSIAVCARNEKELMEMKNSISASYPHVKVIAESVDMGNKSQVLQFAQTILQAFPQVDILVNNAGIFIPGALKEEPDGKLEDMMAVNLFSAYHLTRALLPKMIEKKTGYIFNLCSTASHKAYANGGSYSITKFALLGFSQNLREELKPHNIKVSSVSPGPTWTNSWAGFDGPADRLMPAADIAQIIWTAYTLAPQTVMEEIVLRPMLGDIS